MQAKQDDSLPLRFRETLYAIGYGIQRSFGLLIEYPLECIKTRWQVYPNIKSFCGIIAHSYRSHGISGFYHGLIPSAMRKIPMQLYRWPLLLQLPEYYKSYFNSDGDSKKNNSYIKTALANTLTGLTIGATETLIAAPFESCKLELIVNRDSTKSILQYLRSNRSFKSHYLGVEALLFKETFGWVSFLVSCNLFRQMLRDYNQNKNMQVHQLILLSTLVASINATAIMPWDVIRSQMQRQCREENASFLDISKSIIKQQGIRGLYRGWGIRFFQMSVATGLSVPIMEKFEARSLSLKNQ